MKRIFASPEAQSDFGIRVLWSIFIAFGIYGLLASGQEEFAIVWFLFGSIIPVVTVDQCRKGDTNRRRLTTVFILSFLLLFIGVVLGILRVVPQWVIYIILPMLFGLGAMLRFVPSYHQWDLKPLI